MPIIKLIPYGERFKVEIHKDKQTIVHYFDEYHLALIKASVLRIKYTRNKISPVFVNEVKEHVSTA